MPAKNPSEASRRGRRSKAKGKAFEKRIADMVAEALGLSSGITADDDVVRTRSGQDDCDIGLSERAKAMFPYWLECKNQKTLSVPAWLQQVEEAQARRQDTRTPVIVFKQHRDSTPYAIIPFKHFLELATRPEKSDSEEELDVLAEEEIDASRRDFQCDQCTNIVEYEIGDTHAACPTCGQLFAIQEEEE